MKTIRVLQKCTYGSSKLQPDDIVEIDDRSADWLISQMAAELHESDKPAILRRSLTQVARRSGGCTSCGRSR